MPVSGRHTTPTRSARAPQMLRNTHADFAPQEDPTFPPFEQDLEARPAPRRVLEDVPRAERVSRLGTRHDVYDAPAADDWMLVAIGLGMSSSMVGLLVMLFSGYGAV